VPEILTPDICVIGAGSGGLSVAAAAAAFGVPVVLIEKGKMGGDCLNTGCVPSKALLAAAKHAAEWKTVTPFGLTLPAPRVDFARVHAHVHRVIAAIAPNDSKERFGGLGVQVVEGAARFKDSSTVVVGNVEVKARRFVVATGSRAAVPGIEGLAATPFFTNETIFDLKRAPEHLVIIGAGAVGLELAQAFRRFGAQVTVLEAATALSAADPECATVVLDQLRREGIVIRERVAVTRVGQQDGKIAVVVNDDATAPILGSDLLVAVGRRPNLEGLELDAAGIKYSARGIAVGKGLKSSNKRVYAVGDVAGGQFTHAASYHAGLVIRNALFRLPVRANDDILPWVTFTDPELAHVGLDEAQARARFKTIWVLRWPYHENDRAQAERLTQGHIKVITKKNGLIIGCTIVGAQAGELIAPWTLAVTQRLNIRHMAGIVVPYPTLSEIGKRAAMSYFSASLSNPRLRRLITFLRRFG